MSKFKKLLDTFYPNKKGLFRPKTISRYCLFNGQMRSKAHTALTAPLVLHRTRIGMVNGGINFFCKLHRNCLTGIDQLAMVLSKKYKEAHL
jgi:hypothetical protein